MQTEQRKNGTGSWSEQSYKDLLNSLGGIVWEADAKTTQITFVSEEAERLLGFPTDRWLNDPDLWRDHVHPDDFGRVPFLKDVADSGKRQHQFEYRMISADGRVVWLQDVITVVEEDGVPARLLGVMVDITERKETEERRRLSESRFRALFEQSPIPVQTFAPDGTPLQVNQAYLDMCGLSREEALSVNILRDERLQRLGLTPSIERAFGGEPVELPLTHFDSAFGFEHPRWIKFFIYPVSDTDGSIREVVAVAEDVTERVEAEETLRASEARFRALFEQSPNPICIHRPDGLSISVNRAILDNFRMTPEQASRYNVLEDEQIRDQPEGMRAIQRAFDGEPTSVPRIQFDSNRHGWNDDPIVRYLEGVAYPIRDSRGEMREVVMIWDDVTERDAAEREIRAREDQYRAIFNATTDGLTINDLDGNLVEVNPAFAAMHGYTPEEMMALPPLAFIVPEDRPVVPEAFAAFRQGLRYSRTISHEIRKDGTIFPVEVTGTPFLYRGEPHILCILRDITERQRAFDELREKEEQYRAVFQASVDGLAINDAQGNLVEVNQAFAAMHGYTPEEMAGIHPSAFVHPDSLPQLANFFAAVEAGNTYSCEAVDLRRDGTPFPVHVIGTPFNYKGEQHTLAVVRDISGEKEARDAALRSERRYFDLVNSLDSTVYEWSGPPGDTCFTFVSRQAERLLGYPLQDWLTQSDFWTRHVHPEDRDHVLEYTRQAIAERRPHELEYRMIAADGRTVWIRDMLSTIVEEDPPESTASSADHRSQTPEPQYLRGSGIMLDITRQKQIESDLRVKEQQYRAIFEATTDGLVIGDMQGRTVTVNPAFAAMHGYTPEELVGADPRIFIDPSSHHTFETFYERVLSGQEFKDQALDLRKDGSTFNVEVRGTLFNYQGEPHVLGIIRDITDRVKAYEELRLKEEQYRAVFESTTDGLAIADLQTGAILEVNPAFAAMHGYTRKEMVGIHPTAFVHPDDYAIQQAFVETARRGKRAFAEGRDVRKDGTEFPIEVSGIPFTYNNQPHVLAVMRDITERLRAEEELRLKEEQYRSIFESTTDGLVISDLEGNVLEVNPAFAASLGYTREELVGMDPRRWIHPSSHGNLVEYLKRVAAGERFSIEGLQVRKDGTVFPAEVHEAPFIYNGKRHTLAIIRDITERVQARELLEKRVEERTHELATLLEVSSNVTSTLELNPLLSRILEQLKLVVDYSRASITVDGDEERGQEAVVVMLWGSDSDEPVPSSLELPSWAMGIAGEMMDRGEPAIIADIHDPSDPVAAAVRQAIVSAPDVGDEAKQKQLAQLFNVERSMMLLPLALKDRILGGLFLRHTEPGYYTERHAQLAMAIANQAAIAIENARLYNLAQQAAQSTAALAQIASRVAYGGSLQETLDEVCEHVVRATGAVAAGVILFDPESSERRMVGTYGMPEGYANAVNSVVNSGASLFAHEAFDGKGAVMIGDIRRKVLESEPSAPLHPYMPDAPWDAVVAVPMMYRDEQIGVLASYLPHRKLEASELAFHTAIADQTAVAVQNARLLVQAHDKARLEERQRLARELHDSVTQALFSISLIARSAEVVMQREGGGSPQVMEKLSDLRQLTQGALAEMRALIFELRPGALEEEGLLEALRKHAAAVEGREMIKVEYTCPPPNELPRLKPAAEESLYRIAQEALHNVVKHAKANRVELCITADVERLELRITDDGVGFDPAQVKAGHMGLGTMGDRTRALNGEYRVESTPGKGTTIRVSIPLAAWRLQN
jgi:PAS domain S-box-containing protein